MPWWCNGRPNNFQTICAAFPETADIAGVSHTVVSTGSPPERDGVVLSSIQCHCSDVWMHTNVASVQGKPFCDNGLPTSCAPCR